MHITNAEWKIMELLWQREPWTITELSKELWESTHWIRQTIIIMLQRMVEKGTVRVVTGGRAKLFYPVVTREEAEEEEARAIMEKAFSGSPALLISAIMRQQKIDDREFEEICEMLGVERKKKE